MTNPTASPRAAFGVRHRPVFPIRSPRPAAGSTRRRFVITTLKAAVLLFGFGPLGAAAGPQPELPADLSIPEAIDRAIERGCREANLPTVEPVDDAAFLRRVMLDLAGRTPTCREWQEFVRLERPDKREWVVDRIMSWPDFAYHQRDELSAMLLEGEKSSREWEDYLLEAVRENRPWDVLFRELLLGRTREPNDPSLHFLRVRAGNLDKLTNDVSRLFFGVNVSCAQCHDHPLVADWQQRHYYGMQAFFFRTYLTKSGRVAEKYYGMPKFKTTEGKELTAAFMFLNGRQVSEPAGSLDEKQKKQWDEIVQKQTKDPKAPPPPEPPFSPRKELVELALQNDPQHFLARNIVNRTWARFFSRGLVHPLDQMHSENPPSHPELLDWLARDLIEHGYDLRRLIRGIVLSRAYARPSTWPQKEPPPADRFAVFTVRPLTPAQYGAALKLAASDPDAWPGLEKPDDWDQRLETLRSAARGIAGNIERPGEHFQVSVDEALYFANSDRVQNDLLRDAKGTLVHALLKIEDDGELVAAAFRCVLHRDPDDEERQAFIGALQQRRDDRADAIRDIVWALLTSPQLRFCY